MTSPSETPKNYMAPIGGLILFVVLAYYLFLGIDTIGLTDQSGPAVVISKNYRASETSYATRIINNRSYVTPQTTPEAYVLELELDGRRAETFVSKELFDSVRTSAAVTAIYQIRRLTGELQIIDVKP